jgi:putative Mg2+ transporter-C (MgtC) family protein
VKAYPLVYEARGSDQTRMMESILEAMDKAGERLTGVSATMPSASCSG